MSSERKIATIRSTSSEAADARMLFLRSSGELQKVRSLEQRTGSFILRATASMDFWKDLMPSFRAIPKARWARERAPKGWARKRSRTPLMTAAGLAKRITCLRAVYGIIECKRLAWANSSGELSSARKRWYMVAATLRTIRARSDNADDLLYP